MSEVVNGFLAVLRAFGGEGETIKEQTAKGTPGDVLVVVNKKLDATVMPKGCKGIAYIGDETTILRFKGDKPVLTPEKIAEKDARKAAKKAAKEKNDTVKPIKR